MLVFWQLSIPHKLYFDEIHYIPAARALLYEGRLVNPEHPLLGKLILAASLQLLGDGPAGWRVPGALAGTWTLFAAMRALWFASCRRFATLAYGVLLATGFMLFVQSRIAMLDSFMLAFLATAVWQAAAACREPETGRWRLALTGVMLGLALGAKWNAAPLLPVFGLAFLAARLAAGRRRLLTSRRGWPVPGVSLLEAALWLGVVPLLVYAATFLPGYGLRDGIGTDLLSHNLWMAELQSSVVTAHTYQSSLSQWVLNTRPIWYLFEEVDGAWRGIVMLGNPFTALAGLPALAWCAWRGVRRRDMAALGVVVLYTVSVGFWLVADKPIQFFYHYLVPQLTLLAALALAADALWQRRRWRAAALAIPLASALLFAWFFPILGARPLAEVTTYERWMWLDSWR
ncbi:phospholipid carrier-dependent glycosyltransferase [Qipengyuania thermophila]|uniref:phospholipid carrier-dependent glycosyltransferase n=1 Tax=Qipengyuania thermophila TaxID=2509361 RepID=UPI001F460766|nr:phospholipid carrier-dependent glycosyltransferase [Qipengyuania thermophila]